jgi:predicted DsbA family dithiol-disulfide isomerase
VRATLWSDYLCPWCYVGQHRDGVLAEVGIAVEHLPYELHPKIPPEGKRVRPDGRLTPTLDRVEAECEAAGMPFRRPTRMPNTHRALATAEWVRHHHPEAFAAVHRGCFAAQFVTGDPLDDPDVVDQIVGTAGAPADEVRAAVDARLAEPLIEASMERAREVGVASTPTWVLGEMALPGIFDEATFRRWATRLAQRSTG